MSMSANDAMPGSDARADLSELADQMKAGVEQVVTENDNSYGAIIGANQLDHCRQLDRKQVHLLLIEDASKGLADVSAGSVKDARSTLSAIKRRNATRAAA